MSTVVLAALAACGDDDVVTTGAASGASSASTAASAVASTSGSGGAGGESSSTGSGGSVLPDAFEVSGIVTDGAVPLAGASVLQGGGEVQATTGADGRFTITMRGDQPGIPTVVAGKVGHRSAGQEIYSLPDEPVELVVYAALPPDNEAYVYGEPGTGDVAHDDSTDFCGHCHTTFAATFQTSAHARATKDPWVQDLYAGVAAARGDASACDEVGGERRLGAVPGAPGNDTLRCYVGDGVLPDLNDCGAPGDPACDDPAAGDPPTSFGACADCHGAGMDGVAGGRDLLEAEGVGFDDGNHCDACHHVAAIDLDAPPGTAGRLVLQRPGERISQGPPVRLRQVMYGPFLDVPNPFMGGSPQPQITEAVFCAGCHEQTQAALVPGDELDAGRWPDGLPTHSTFSEWSESEYAAAGIPCQGCHMPPIAGMFNSVDVAGLDGGSVSDGFARPAERNRSHAFVGALEGSPRMIDQAMFLTLEGVVSGNELTVDATIQNAGAGHAVPTGEPLRSLLLAIAVDACGEPAMATAGGSLGLGAGSFATASVGGDVSPGETTTLAWPGAAAVATVGQRLRVVRPSGAFLDYPGIGSFVGLAAEDKGKPILVPVGEAAIVAVDGDTLALDRALSLVAGDSVVLGDALGDDPEGAAASALAGLPGRDFQRVLRDGAGRTLVPHHRANDIVSDDRIPPSGEVTSSHAFAVPSGCDEVTIRATLLYRRAPFALARERGWELREHVAATTQIVVPVVR